MTHLHLRTGLRYNKDARAARRPSTAMVPGLGGTCLPAEPPRPIFFETRRPITGSALFLLRFQFRASMVVATAMLQWTTITSWANAPRCCLVDQRQTFVLHSS